MLDCSWALIPPLLAFSMVAIEVSDLALERRGLDVKTRTTVDYIDPLAF